MLKAIFSRSLLYLLLVGWLLLVSHGFDAGYGKVEPRSVLEKEDLNNKEVPTPPSPLLYGPEGINDPFLASEGKNYTLGEDGDEEAYFKEAKRWNPKKDMKITERPSSYGSDGGQCLSYSYISKESEKNVDVFFKGEFGYELMVVLPFAYFHFLNGSLRSTTSCGDESSFLFYWFSPKHSVDRNCKRNDFKNSVKPYGWKRGLHKSRIPKAWFPPPFAEHFREWGKVWPEVATGSPLVVISNKISNEWKRGPINFFDLDMLRHLIINFVKAGYYVVYNRPGNAVAEDEWQEDTAALKFDDYKFIRKLYLKDEFKGKVRLMQDIHYNNPGTSFNEIQVRMMARSRCFLSVQGGNSILSSYFGGINIIYTRLGFEADFDTYKKHYVKLSGAKVHVARSYHSVGKLVTKLLKLELCNSI